MVESLMSQDWEPFIQSMVAKTQTPQLNIQKTKEQAIQKKISELSTFESHLFALQSNLRKVGDGSCFESRTVNVANNDLISVTAGSGTLNGDYSVEVIKLASPSKQQGVEQICASLEDSNVALSHFPAFIEGTFSVNGHAISVKSTDTLKNVFNQLESIGISASYATETDKITLTSANSEAIYLGASNDTSNLLSLFQLYSNGTSEITSLTRINRLKMDVAVSEDNLKTPVTEDGTFSINGVNIDYKKTDTLFSIIANVNRSKAGVFIHYSPLTQSFSVQNKNTGSLGISVQDIHGNLMSALGFLDENSKFTLGEQAEISINGSQTLHCNSNTFKEEQHGMRGINIQAMQVGTSNFSISTNEDTALQTVKNFISKYNELYTYLQNQTKADPQAKQYGVFHDNSELKSFMRNLRNAMFGIDLENPTASKLVQLSQIGIQFNSDHQLSLDETRFKEQLRFDPNILLDKLSSYKEGGAVQQGLKFLSNFIEKSSKTLKKTLTTQRSSVQRKTEQLKHQFDIQEKTWRNTFNRISQTNAQLLSQMQAVKNLGK